MRVIIFVLAALALAVLAATLGWVNPAARVASAYVGKTLCSEVFLAGRDEAVVRKVDLANISPALQAVHADIDRGRRRVEAALFGLGRATVMYRPGFGCTIEAGGAPAALPVLHSIAAGAAWPDATAEAPTRRGVVDYEKLNAALDAAIADDKTATRAIFVVVDGEKAGARFRDGFNAETPFLSWSMAKSVNATIVGAAAYKGYLDPAAPAPVAEWARDGAKSKITWNDLLRMQSGLAFSEAYGDPGSDVSRDLFVVRDAGRYAALRPVAHAPGEVWSYSSGTANLLARTLRRTLEARGLDYFNFAREAVFGPIGATSFVLEPDSSGTPIGSSYVYATVGDWARLGALYLNDGVVDGVRVLPEGWVKAATTPAPPADGQYGLQIWLNHPGADGRPKAFPGAPDDMYYFSGHEGQFVFVIPEKKMIVVRTGITRGQDAEAAFAPTLAALYAAVAPQP